MLLLAVLDFLFVSHAYHSILSRGASVQLVFGFEVRPAPAGDRRPRAGQTDSAVSPRSTPS